LIDRDADQRSSNETIPCGAVSVFNGLPLKDSQNISVPAAMALKTSVGNAAFPSRTYGFGMLAIHWQAFESQDVTRTSQANHDDSSNDRINHLVTDLMYSVSSSL
jgi:hypothetical protein